MLKSVWVLAFGFGTRLAIGWGSRSSEGERYRASNNHSS